MVQIKAKVRWDGLKVAQAARKASITKLGHAGAAIRLTARRSIRRRAKASPPGSPPHTRQGRLRQAITYAVAKDQGSVVIGPDVAVAGTSGQAHEYGGTYRQAHYPKRPFMGPAFQQIKPRLPRLWANSVK